MNEEEILIAKLRAKGVSEKAIKRIIEFYKEYSPFSSSCLRVKLKERKK